MLHIVTEHSPPGGYLDESGRVIGPTTELLRLLAKRLHQPIEISLMPWARALTIARTEANTAIFETVRNAEREHWFRWVGPLKHYTIWLYGRADRIDPSVPKNKLSDHYIACEYRGSVYIDHLARLGFIQGRNLIVTVSKEDCRDMLLRKRVDLTTWNDAFTASVNSELAEQNTKMKKLTPIDDIQLYLAFSLDHEQATVDRWQQALEQSYQDGSMRALYQSRYPEAVIKRLEQFAAKSSTSSSSEQH
ncbi:transporter substrate-binding domain-containing protein [Lacimicrobium sp. SS2-24]|uniref:substrate-binding periplasmic protein n=1 Tax=Lacimicrobium sp. SS2-24 TaxID=2005569 RepID=UPI001130F18A|nr:transporter substrate-binding domain-containing protein [Lacimicrobium sp. SS2-24]